MKTSETKEAELIAKSIVSNAKQGQDFKDFLIIAANILNSGGGPFGWEWEVNYYLKDISKKQCKLIVKDIESIPEHEPVVAVEKKPNIKEGVLIQMNNSNRKKANLEAIKLREAAPIKKFLANEFNELQELPLEIAQIVIELLGGEVSFEKNYSQKLSMYKLINRPLGTNKNTLTHFSKHQASYLDYLAHLVKETRHQSIVMYVHKRCATYEVQVNNRTPTLDNVAEAIYNPLMGESETSVAVLSHIIKKAIVDVCRAYHHFAEREIVSDKLALFFSQSKTNPDGYMMDQNLTSLLIKEIGGEEKFTEFLNNTNISEGATTNTRKVFSEPYYAYVFYLKNKGLVLNFIDKVSASKDYNGTDLHNGIVDFVTSYLLKNNYHQDQVADGLFSAVKGQDAPSKNNLLVSNVVMNYCVNYLCESYLKFKQSRQEEVSDE